ncbi:DUF6707 family protein [Capnocytophaga sputigena]|uniref:DUF6707 family protein n=1 Tax=Capnocytophaga sputigena TaxID=1019 RepID=UPI0028D4CD3C|nr:DUF6707 family protein [Capnocytophaga sputigena]
MNIEILAPYCTTAKQQKLLEKLRKKLSLKSSKDLQTVVELVECLFVSKQYEGLLAFLPEVLAVPFAANFNLWYPIERSFALIAEVPTITTEQRKACFLHFKSVTDYKGLPDFQDMYDYYFQDYLTLYFLNNTLEYLQKSISEKETSYEFSYRMNLIIDASRVKLINEEVDYKTLEFPKEDRQPTYNSREELQDYMNTLIAEQLTALQDKKFIKYY